MLSVNTNTGAMTALQYLTNTSSQLQQTEQVVSTGLKISSAKDNGAIYAIAQNMRGNVAAYSAVTDSLNRGMSAVDTATSAAQSVSDLLIQMKQNALAASDSSLDSTSRASLASDFQAMADQITTIVENASFNGVNLISDAAGTGAGQSISALASASDDSQTISVAGQNLTVTNLSVGTAYTTQTTAATMVGTVSAAMATVNTALSALSSGSKKFSIQANFVSQLSDTLTTGIGNLVDANMAQESALLTSLQTKQQLGIQALSIANSAPSAILSLFR
ncbi:MAG: flagellin [Rhizomicrobium sp.]|jgi:flagellin